LLSSECAAATFSINSDFVISLAIVSSRKKYGFQLK
jgi:hypothetical protein